MRIHTPDQTAYGPDYRRAHGSYLREFRSHGNSSGTRITRGFLIGTGIGMGNGNNPVEMELHLGPISCVHVRNS